MKVVQINTVYHLSSTGRTTEEMHLFLKEQGIESYVFCVGTDEPENNVFSIGNTADHKIHALMSRVSGLQGYWSQCATHRLVRHLKQINPDIVILRNLHSNFINLPILFKYLHQAQPHVIWVLHDMWGMTGGCVHYTMDNCYKWQSECRECKLACTKNGSWLFDRSRKIFRDRCRFFSGLNSLSVLGVSDWTVNEAKQSVTFRNATRFQRIYNWINLDVFRPRQTNVRHELGLKDSDFVIIGVAQGWPEERVLLFKQIAHRLPDLKIVMVGALNAELPDNIIHLNATSDVNRLAEYYSMADVFLNFSQQETFGKVSAEALACGTPVVANNNTATPEVVGDCGDVISNNNINECVDAIKKIQQNGKSHYSDKCVERARTLFSKDKNLQSYLNLFVELCSRGVR